MLVPRIQEQDGELVDVHQKVRDDFYEALTEFASTLKIALQSATFLKTKALATVTEDITKKRSNNLVAFANWSTRHRRNRRL